MTTQNPYSAGPIAPPFRVRCDGCRLQSNDYEPGEAHTSCHFGGRWRARPQITPRPDLIPAVDATRRVPMSVKILAKTAASLRLMAAAEKRTMSSIVDEAIRDFYVHNIPAVRHLIRSAESGLANRTSEGAK